MKNSKFPSIFFSSSNWQYWNKTVLSYDLRKRSEHLTPVFQPPTSVKKTFSSCLTNTESQETNRLLSGEETLLVPSQKFGQEFRICAEAQVSPWKYTFYWLWCLSKTVFFFSFFPYRCVAITNIYYDCQTQLNPLLTCRPYKLQGVFKTTCFGHTGDHHQVYKSLISMYTVPMHNVYIEIRLL